jgi:hypothetical protein
MEQNKQDHSVTMLKANLYSLVFGLLPAVGLAVIYIGVWGVPFFAQGLGALFGNLLLFLGIFLAGIVVHELLHGATWVILGRKPLNAVKFGVQSLTPYAHLKEPIEVNAYRWGAFMPGLVLGLLPALVGILTGNGFLIAFGLLFVSAAGGDLLILWLIRKVPAGRMVEDHPTNAGCYVLEG